jgi:hypothetical protein
LKLAALIKAEMATDARYRGGRRSFPAWFRPAGVRDTRFDLSDSVKGECHVVRYALKIVHSQEQATVFRKRRDEG